MKCVLNIIIMITKSTLEIDHQSTGHDHEIHIEGYCMYIHPVLAGPVESGCCCDIIM